MTVTEIVETYHISHASVYRLHKKRKLPGFKIGNQLRFWPEDVEAALTREPKPAQERAKLLDADTISFLSELASAAPALTEEQRDTIRAAFRGAS